MSLTRPQTIKAEQLNDKLRNLPVDTTCVIGTSQHEIRVVKGNDNYTLSDDNEIPRSRAYTGIQELTEQIKKALNITGTASVSYTAAAANSLELPPEIKNKFSDLHPQVQALFGSLDDLKQPWKILAKQAGLTGDNISAPQLMAALNKKDIMINTYDIAILDAISKLVDTKKPQPRNK